MFVTKDRVPVTVGDNTIFIRAKMDFGTRQRVIGAGVHLRPGEGAEGREMDIAGYQIAMLAHNIVGWDGPAFAGVECTAAAIESLDPGELLVERVLEEISARNSAAREDAPDPKPSPAVGDGS